MADLDQGGIQRFSKVWLGPSLGWGFLPVAPEIIFTTPTPITILPGMSVVLIKLPAPQPVLVNLPDVNLWVTQAFDLGRTRSNLDRSILVKDVGGTCSAANPFTIMPLGTQRIDGQPSISLQGTFSWAKLFPLNDLTGWFMGA
jgi:hypothetical protein